MKAGLSPRCAAWLSTSSVIDTSGMSTSGYSERMMRSARMASVTMKSPSPGLTRQEYARPPGGATAITRYAARASRVWAGAHSKLAHQSLVRDDPIQSREHREHHLIRPSTNRQQARVAKEPR